MQLRAMASSLSRLIRRLASAVRRCIAAQTGGAFLGPKTWLPLARASSARPLSCAKALPVRRFKSVSRASSDSGLNSHDSVDRARGPIAASTLAISWSHVMDTLSLRSTVEPMPYLPFSPSVTIDCGSGSPSGHISVEVIDPHLKHSMSIAMRARGS
jgi:hypothetical protein